MITNFERLPIGAVFEFHGACYRKIELSMAEDERQWGNLFDDFTPVVADDGVQLVPSRRRADALHRIDNTAPGQTR
jgi:hypothetical protein